MELHHSLEGFEVVDWVRGLVVTLKLREFEVRRNGLLHNLGREWRVGANIVIADGGGMKELLDPPVYLLKLLIENIISITNLKGWSAEQRQRSSWGRIMVVTGALRSLLPLFEGYRLTCLGRPS